MTGFRNGRDSPRIGEHTTGVLLVAGVSKAEIDELVDRGVAIRGL